MNKKVVVKEIVLLTVIIDRERRDSLIALLSEAGGQLINTMYGKGLVNAAPLMEAFGLVSEENRVIITCLLPSEESEPMIKTLVEKFDLGKLNTGAAFTVPVEELSF